MAKATDSSGLPGRVMNVALRVRAMSSRMTSMGAMYAVWLFSDHARTWPQMRPVDFSNTHAPESPGTKWTRGLFSLCSLCFLFNKFEVGQSLTSKVPVDAETGRKRLSSM